MTIQFEPSLPSWSLLPLAVLVFIFIFIFYRGYKPVVSKPFWWFLVSLKIFSFAAVVLLLLNPALIFKTPDTRQVNIVFLVDGTSSMQTKDVKGRTRIQFVKDNILNLASDFYSQIFKRYSNSHVFLFAGEELRRLHPGSSFSVLPGDTDIDFVLADTLESPVDQNPLGAVVLISDGLDNKGLSLMEAVKKYKKAGVPIHCVGIGDPRSKMDIGVVWKDVPKKIPKNQNLKLTALITSNNTKEVPVSVRILENGRVIGSREVILDPENPEKEVIFEHTPFTSGFNTYKIEAASLPGEYNILNNKDFIGVEITAPDLFTTLFFGANLDWEYKFLNRFSEKEDRLSLDASIRLDEHSFYSLGLDEKNQKENQGLPECSILNKYDCLIIQLGALELLDKDQISCIINFVENRGGGIIFLGQIDEIPGEIMDLLPIKEWPEDTLKTTRDHLRFRPSKILSSGELGDVNQLANQLFIPPGSEMIRLENSAIKPAAIEVASAVGTGLVALVVQFYGSGKVAVLNIPDTWKWVMIEEEGKYYYGVFWGRLISWVASSSKDRITVQPPPKKLRLTDTQEFLVDILDPNFLPENTAQVSCTIIGPGRKDQKMDLISDSKVDGRYKGKFIPKEQGEYRFYFKANPNKGKTLEVVNDYVVIDMSPESEPHPMAERKLQSLARQTGGSYWNCKDLESIKDLELSKKLSYREQKRNFRDYWWYFAIILMFVLPDWIFRRRIGLK